MRLTRYFALAWVLAAGGYWGPPGVIPCLEAASWLPSSKARAVPGGGGTSGKTKGPEAREKAAAPGLSAFAVPAESEPYPSRWVAADSGQSIPYLVDAEVLPDGLSLEAALAAVTRAFSAWEAACPLRFYLEAVVPFGASADLVPNRDGRIRLQLHDSHERIGDADLAAFGGLLTTSEPLGLGAGGRVFHQEFHRTTGGYVILNHRQSIFSDVVTLEEVLAHEIGHALGLAHSSEDLGEADPELRESLMYAVVHGDGRGSQLSDRDRAVLETAYPEILPPPAFSSWFDVPTVAAGADVLLPELLRLPVHRGPVDAGSGVIPWSVRLYNARTTSNYGEFVEEDGDIVYSPIGFFQLPPHSPDSGRFYDRAVFRIESGAHGSSVEVARMLGLQRDGWGQPPDGLPDPWVEMWFGEGVVLDAFADADGDGCSEVDEFLQNTDPLDPESCVLVNVELLQESTSESGGELGLTVDSGRPASRPIALRLTLSGTATAGEDYQLPEQFASGILIPPGSQRLTVPLTLVDDDLSEGPELLRVEIVEVHGAGIGASTATQTLILDNEELPTYSLAHPSFETREGDAEGVPIQVLRSGRVNAPSCVQIQVVEETAETALDPAADLGDSSWNLCFGAGETEGILWLYAVDDSVRESAELGRLRLAVIEGGGLVDPEAAEAVVQVLDNDGEPEISATAAPAQEGEVHAEVSLRLSHGSGTPVKVHYRLESGSAREGEDFLHSSGTHEFLPGELEGKVYAALTDDPWSEDAEEFYFVVTAVEGGTTRAPRIAIALSDNEGLPGLHTPAQVEAEEGEALDVSIALSVASAEPAEYAWRVVGRMDSTEADAPAEGGVLRFSPGQTAGILSIQLPEDDLDEPEESIYLEWTGLLRAQPGPFVTEIVIADNDPRPVLLLDDVALHEGDAPAQARAPFQLSNASGFTVTVQVSVVPGLATAGSDYVLSRSLVTIPPGVVRPEWSFRLVDDFRHESTEDCELRIGILRNALVSRTRSLITIHDDDPADALNLSSANVAEQDGAVIVELSRSTLSEAPVQVGYRTIPGTAAESADYESAAGVAIFEPESWSTFIEVRLLDDLLDEDAESFEIELMNTTEYTAVRDRSLVTIDDDDPEPRLEGEWKNVRENAGSVVLGLTLSEPSGRVVHGVLSPNGGSATPGEDFEQGVFPFQILPGQQVAEVEIAVVDDGTAEDTETVLLQFDALANALADSGELGFSIEDDDIVDEREEIVLRPDVGGGFSVHWRGRRGGNYAIEQSVDLRVWEAWPDFRGDATGEWQAAAIELEGVPVRFLRLSRREVDSGILTSPPQAPAGDSG